MEWLKSDRVLGAFGGLIAVIAFAVAEPQALRLTTRDDAPASRSIDATGAGQAVWSDTGGTMPNGKSAGLWTLPDGFSFRGAGDLTQERVRSLATALRQSELASSPSPVDPIEAYVASRLASGVSINELRALTGMSRGSADYPGVSNLPSRRNRAVAPQYDLSSIPPGGSPITRGSEYRSESGIHGSRITVPGPAYRRGSVGERLTQYDPPVRTGGMVNSRSGEYYAPAGESGYVSTRDGTYFSRSGPNGVIDTRTGRYIPTN